MMKSNIYDLVVKHTKMVISDFNEPDTKITINSHFVNLGASSCDRVEIVSELLEVLSLEIEPKDVLDASTIQEMGDIIYEKMSPSRN